MSLKIFIAINQIQKKVRNATTDSNNPHYRSTYASLESVLDLLRPMWAEAGLAVTQDVFEGSLRTRVVHAESGDSFDFCYRMINAKGDLHGEGAAFTYSRRQALKGIFGIAEEDDDGNRATNQPAQQKSPPPKTNQPPPQLTNHAKPGGKISEAQFKRAQAIAHKAGWDKDTLVQSLLQVARDAYGVRFSEMEKFDYDELCAAIEAGSSAGAIIEAKRRG